MNLVSAMAGATQEWGTVAVRTEAVVVEGGYRKYPWAPMKIEQVGDMFFRSFEERPRILWISRLTYECSVPLGQVRLAEVHHGAP